jgi:nucleoside-diphosphate-sugar epimerase
MKVLVAGATGAIGRPLIRCLKEGGHTVFGLVRSSDSEATLLQMGAEAVTADALDAASVKAAIERIRPDAIINELTSLPRHYTSEEMKAAADHDRTVRTRGNINLLAAMHDAGVRRYILQSSGFWYAPGAGLPLKRRRLPSMRLPGSPPVPVTMFSWKRLRSKQGRYNASLCVTDFSMGQAPGTQAMAIWASRCANGVSRSSARARALRALST